jgi:hypothetical protein
MGQKATPFTESQILAWADVWHARTGRWPTQRSGPIPEAPGETWIRVDDALERGLRGLAGGSSLPRLLQAHRGMRNIKRLPRLSVTRIVAWARAHRRRTGQWPRAHSGHVADSNGENWGSIDNWLRNGGRGLPGGSSVSRLLVQYCGHRNPKDLPPLSEAKIWQWAQAHYRRTGVWPPANSGPVREAPGETWNGIDKALTRGRRGLRGGSSLYRLLKERQQESEAGQGRSQASHSPAKPKK